MRLSEIKDKYQHIWYHGSGMDFKTFDLGAEKANRSTNPDGIYLTKQEDVAREYAKYAHKRQGVSYIYEVEIDVVNPFYEGRSVVSQEMIEAYGKELVNRTTYQEKWVRDNLMPMYAKTGNMKADLPGKIKTEVMKAGGHDAFFFNDMGDNVCVVFDPADINILNKFTPQELVKDPEYDNLIKQPEKEPEPEPPKKEKKPRPGDDDQLGQLLHDFDF